jgi:polyisoprenoid-binding protein YceI
MEDEVMRYVVPFFALALIPLGASSAPVSYTVDPAHTFPYFEINHLGFSTVRGRFDSTEGKISLDQANKTGSVDIAIDASSVDTAHEKRDEHLRSPDFLNAAEFPKITYKSTKVTINADGTAKVDGNLSMAGVTKPVSLDVKRFNCGANPMSKKEMCGFDAVATIKRSEFGVNYALPAIGDEMKILLNVEAYKD